MKRHSPARRRAPRARRAAPAARSSPLLLLLLLTFAAGCPPQSGGLGAPPPADSRPPPPSRATQEVVRHVNDNCPAPGATLYSPVVTVTGALRDRDGKRHDLDLRGVLVMKAPRSIFLRLDHALESGQIQLGANDEEYWVAIRRGYETMWWGRQVNIGRPGMESLPIDPPRVADALGLRKLPERGVLGPMRISDQSYDRLIYGRPNDDTGTASDRVYYVDRHPPFLVRGIDYLDAHGEVEMQVVLSRYAPVPGLSGLRAGRIEINWPGRNSVMKIDIEGLRVPETVHPRTFIRPTEPPEGIRTMRQIDEMYESGGFGAESDAGRRDASTPGAQETP